MSDDQKKPGQDDDHSIEEILASIRRIISDDDEAEPAAEVKPAEEPAPSVAEPEPEKAEEQPVEEPAQAEEEDILELTEVVEEEPEQDIASAEDIDALMNENIDANDDFDDIPDVLDELDAQKEAEEPVIVMNDRPEEDDEPLVDDDVASIASETLSKLSDTLKETKSSSHSVASQVLVGSISLEDIVRQEVKPIIKQWLDDNLAEVVERIVEKEVARLKNRLQD